MHYRKQRAIIEVILAAKPREIDTINQCAVWRDNAEWPLLPEADPRPHFWWHWSASVWVIFSSPAVAAFISSLRSTIAHVIGLRPEPKMVWAHTSRVVAAVKDKKSLVKMSVRQLVRQAMAHVFNFVDAYRTVAGSINGACPVPTGFCFVDLGPEFFERHAQFTHIRIHSVNA